MLMNEIEQARKKVVKDGYDMSIGELMNLYRDGELYINPEFQRLFRWDPVRKTKFIESLILGIPTPPIFVFQNEDGVWELIDGLQRVSTVLEFTGILKKEGIPCDPLELVATEFLPSLMGMKWESNDKSTQIGKPLQLEIKRARIRVEILGVQSDQNAKYELFQRLNTGGVALSEQEIRNCIAVMVNPKLHKWLKECASNKHFLNTTSLSESNTEKQGDVELALKFFAFRDTEYRSNLDVNEYLTEALLNIANKVDFPYDEEKKVFEKTFKILDITLGPNSFKRFTGSEFKGRFLHSIYEVFVYGVSLNLDPISKLSDTDRSNFLRQKAESLQTNPTYKNYSGGGVRGSTRLKHLLPMAATFFKP